MLNVTASANSPNSFNLFQNNSEPGIVTVIQPPLNGNVTTDSDGVLAYTPEPGFVGRDEATVEACDQDGVCHTVILEFMVQSPANSEDGGGSNKEALYALLGLILAPLLWFFQEPLNRYFHLYCFQDKEGGAAATATSVTGSSSIPTLIAVSKPGPGIQSVPTGSVGTSLNPPVAQSGDLQSSSFDSESQSFDSESEAAGSFTRNTQESHESLGENEC